MDRNQDGRLTGDEIRLQMNALLDQRCGYYLMSRDQFMLLVDTLDKDANGYVDYEEFISAASNKIDLINHSNLLFAFKQLDRDQSGMISIDELKQAVSSTAAATTTARNTKSDHMWHTIMLEVDKNRDNQISYEELEQVM